jgi:PPP family 3-phenylpropionic acid transporter
VSRTLYWQLAGFYFFYFAYLGAFAPYFSLYLDSLGYGAAAIAMLLALPQVMRIFAPHLWGLLADRTSQRVRIVYLTGAAGTLCYLGVFAANAWAWLFACIALWSFFWSAALPLMESATLDHLGSRSAQYGRIRLWGSLGFIAAVVGVGALLDIVPMAVLLPVVGAAMAGILLVTWRVPEPRRDVRATQSAPIAHVLRSREVIGLIGACFMMAVAHGPYYTFFSLHLAAQSYSKTAIGWMWAVGVIAEIAVFAGLPWLNRRFSPRALLIASLAIAAVRFVLIGWAAQFAAILFAAQLMHAATFGVFHAAALVSVHRLFQGPNQARGQAVYSSLCYGLGGTLGGLGSGIAWEWLGPALTFGAASLCALLGILLLLALSKKTAERSRETDCA